MSEAPACPNCARAMAPVRQSERAKPRHDVYCCGNCGAIFSEAPATGSDANDRALVLLFGGDRSRH